MNEAKHTPGPILPTYYVRHPDGSFSIAEPQPSIEQIAAQRTTYAQCDHVHGGWVCEDPDCYRSAKATALPAADPQPLEKT